MRSATGDSDLGITVATGWQEVANSPAGDVGMAFLATSKAFSASSSSYGTLTATR
jgi:hypothetical protein